MKTIKNKYYDGERPLFETHDTLLNQVVIGEGESALKQCSDIALYKCKFKGKYPLWHVNHSTLYKCTFDKEARSAIWYSNHMRMKDCTINASKMFREMNDLHLDNVVSTDSDEMFWNINGLWCNNVEIKNGTYGFMNCNIVSIDHAVITNNYIFQYAKNVYITDSMIKSKDAFWESDHVSIYNSILEGEYLGWHSKNLYLENCHIIGEQPLCYADNVQLCDCTFDSSCDRMFEYSTVKGNVKGHIENIKNPTSGYINCESLGSLTIDENVREPNNFVVNEFELF